MGAASAKSKRQPALQTSRKVIGYYTNWSQYRHSGADDDDNRADQWRFVPESIDATLLTHVCFAFAKVSRAFEVESTEWNDVEAADGALGMYARLLRHVRAQNPAIKTIIALGGWTFNERADTKHIFSEMASTRRSRKTFIGSAIGFAQKHGFDGVAIDWEYPAFQAQGGRPADKRNFALLIAEFRQAICELQAPLLLCIDVAATQSIVASAYDVAQLHPHLDWIAIMAYDLRNGGASHTSAHTALSSVREAIDVWTHSGAASNKLVLGFPAYGRSFTLRQASDAAIGAPALGPGAAGPITKDAGVLASYEIEAMKAKGAKTVFDARKGAVVTSLKQQWVSYDDERTLRRKLALVDANGLSGVMMWSLDLDDFRAGFPLLRVAAQHAGLVRRAADD